MSTRNEQLARRFAEGVLGGADPTAFNDLIDDNIWVSTGLKPDAPIIGKVEYGQVLGSTLGKAFSEGQLTVEEILNIPPDRVLVRFTAKAKHSGELFGVPPSGKNITMAEIHLLRFKDEKIVENYVGALNPLSFEMIFSKHISSLIL